MLFVENGQEKIVSAAPLELISTHSEFAPQLVTNARPGTPRMVSA